MTHGEDQLQVNEELVGCLDDVIQRLLGHEEVGHQALGWLQVPVAHLSGLREVRFDPR
jgi:hypothetical protein